MNGFQILFAGMTLTALLLFGAIWTFQTYGVYRFSQITKLPEEFGLTEVKVINFTSEDGAAAQAWLVMPDPGRPVLFSFHGNYAAIGPSLQRLAPLMADGIGIVMLQYRGAGGLSGRSSEESFARDARALYDQLDTLAGQTIPPDRRVLHGFSLGVGVGSRLAAERSFAAVVLEASFPRSCAYYQRRYRGFPFCTLMWAERYDVIDRIGKIDAPKLFVHGTLDMAIPLLWGRQLFTAASGPKTFVELPKGGHADLAAHGLIEAVEDFLHQKFD